MSRVATEGVEEASGCTVYGALALTLYVSRLLGVAPLQMRRARSNSWRITVSRALTLYGYVLLTLLHSGLLYGLILDFVLPSERSIRVRTASSTFAWILVVLIISSITTSGVIDGPNRMIMMIEYLYKLDNVQKLIKKQTPVKKFSKSHAWKPSGENKKIITVIILLLVTCVLFALELAAFGINTEGRDREMTVVLLYICFYVEYLMVFLLELQFVFVGFLIESSLRCINHSLEEFIQLCDLHVNYESYTLIDGFLDIKMPILKKKMGINYQDIRVTSDKILKPRISSYTVSYAAVSEVMKKVNSSFERLITMFLGLIFVQWVIAVYSYVFPLSIGGTGPLHISVDILYCIWHTFILFLASEPGQRIRLQERDLRTLLSHIFRRTTPGDPNCIELHFLYEQVTLDQSPFLVGGICKLRLSLGFAIFSAVFTYITFILQLQLSE